MYDSIIKSLSDLYVLDSRPWVLGYSGGKDSTMIVSLVFEALATLPRKARTKEIAVVCTDTRVEIPAVVQRVAGELGAMNRASKVANFGVTAHLLKPPAEESFWVAHAGQKAAPARKRSGHAPRKNMACGGTTTCRGAGFQRRLKKSQPMK